MVPTGSHQKRLAEQGQFRASHSNLRRPVRSVEQPIDEVAYEVVHPDDNVADEAVANEVAYEVVLSNVVVVDLVPYVIADTELTTPSTEPSVHIDGEFPRGPIDRSLFIKYADHVAYRL